MHICLCSLLSALPCASVYMYVSATTYSLNSPWETSKTILYSCIMCCTSFQLKSLNLTSVCLTWVAHALKWCRTCHQNFFKGLVEAQGRCSADAEVKTLKGFFSVVYIAWFRVSYTVSWSWRVLCQTAHQDTVLLTQILQPALPMWALPSALLVKLWDHSSSYDPAQKHTTETPWQNKSLLPLCMDAHPQEGETVSFLTHRQTYLKSCDQILSYQHYARDKQNSSYHRFLSYIGRTWRTVKQKGNRILAAN